MYAPKTDKSLVSGPRSRWDGYEEERWGNSYSENSSQSIEETTSTEQNLENNNEVSESINTNEKKLAHYYNIIRRNDGSETNRTYSHSHEYANLSSYGLKWKPTETTDIERIFDSNKKLLDERVAKGVTPESNKYSPKPTEYLYKRTYQEYTKTGDYKTLDDGKIVYKIPNPDHIIKGNSGEIKYYLLEPAMEVKYASTQFVWDKNMIVSFEELKKEVIDEQLMEMGVENNYMNNIDIKVSKPITDVDGRLRYQVDIKVVPYVKSEINSPMTLTGGDGSTGYKEIKKCPYTYGDILEHVERWKKEVGYGTNYPINMIMDGIAYSMGGDDNRISKFKEASKSGGAFDIKQGLEEGVLYEFNGKYYNTNEMGNFWWGFIGADCGFILEELKKGGETFVKNQGRKFDEPWEVAAYVSGYYYYFNR